MSDKRYVCCTLSDRILHGKSYRKPLTNPTLLQKLVREKWEPGTYYDLDLLTQAETENAFREFQNSVSPRSFKIQTRDGGSLSLDYTLDKKLVGIDCWLDDCAIDTASIKYGEAGKLLAFIFEDKSDKEVESYILKIKI